jgi:hypothetical protein
MRKTLVDPQHLKKKRNSQYLRHAYTNNLFPGYKKKSNLTGHSGLYPETHSHGEGINNVINPLQACQLSIFKGMSSSVLPAIPQMRKATTPSY